jgi:SAM-dependent methyltransferase
MLAKQLETTAPEGPNAEQIRYWNEVGGKTWAGLEAKLSAQLRPFGELAMARAGIGRGSRVLDVGCGGGDTTRALARQVGPEGAVTGVDISEALLSVAERAAREEGLENVRLLLADAQSAALPEAAFDVVFSRFGVMFFGDPEAAFSNLGRALVPGGRLAFVCWRSPLENPWMWVPAAAAAKHVPIELPQPGAPGPCGLADAQRTKRILTAAGLAEVEIVATDLPVSLGDARSLDEAADFLMEVGPAARAIRAAGGAGTDAVRASIREALTPYATDAGVLMDGAIWVVTARRPAIAPARRPAS